MKKMTILIVVLALVAGVLFGEGQTAKKGYVFATDSTWPPMEYINENKELVGFDIDLVRAIAEAEGFEVSFVSTNWDGIFAGLINGEYDAVVSSVTITEERQKSMSFSDPYFNAGQQLAVQNEMAASVRGLADLSGKPVGAQIGTSAALLIQEEFPEVILKTYDDLGPAVEELARGTISGIVADVPLIVDYLLNNKKYSGRFVAVGDPMTDEEYGIALGKDNAELREKINRGLARVKSNGEYDRIYAQWIK